MKEPIEILYDTCKDVLKNPEKEKAPAFEEFKKEFGEDEVMKAILQAMETYADEKCNCNVQR